MSARVPSRKDVVLDIDAVREWFTRLYGDTYKAELINIVHGDHSGGVNNGNWSGDTDALTYLDPLILSTVRRFDELSPTGIYHRVTTLKNAPARGRRGTSGQSSMLPGLWADIDIAGPGHATTEPLPADESAARLIVENSALPEPTLWVHSGGGLYPYWLLDKPAEITTNNFAEIKQLSEDWHEELARSARELGMHYGTGIGDLARVLRIPGTVNRKAGLSRPCRVLSDDGTTYTIEQFREIAPRVAPLAREGYLSKLNREGADADDIDVWASSLSWSELLTEDGWTEAGTDSCNCPIFTAPGVHSSPKSATAHEDGCTSYKTDQGHAPIHIWTADPPPFLKGAATLSKLNYVAARDFGGNVREAMKALGLKPKRTVSELTPVDDLFATPSAPVSVNGNTPETVPEKSPEIDEEAFWNARPILQHIREFAKARYASPWATFGAVAARAVAVVPPSVVLPPVIGSVGSLNLFVANVAASGGGKDAAKNVATDAVLFDPIREPVHTRELGTGQGITAQYMRLEKNDETGEKELRQFRESVLFTLAEIDQLKAHAGQQGANIVPTLTAAWMAEPLGNAYKDKNLDQPVEEHSYRMCLRANVQPARGAVLLEAVHLGLPQRFVWLPADDPNMGENVGECPEPMTVKLPLHDLFDPFTQPKEGEKRQKTVMTLCESARAEIIADRLVKGRGEWEGNPLDSHLLFSREKFAAVFALIDNRLDITEEDWELSGIVMAKSIETRTKVVDSLKTAAKDVATARRDEAVQVATAIETAKDEQGAIRVGRAIHKKLTAEWQPSSDIKRTLASRDKALFEDGLDKLREHGHVEIQTGEYRGQKTLKLKLP